MTSTPNIYCFIPCNLGSKRLPNKPLLEKNGKSILEHTYELASQIRCLTKSPIILSDSQEILQKALSKEIDTLCTPKLDNGTLRCAWAAQHKNLNDNDIIINVQVDEVEFDPEIISRCIRTVLNSRQPLTFAKEFDSLQKQINTNNVKVSTNSTGEALYFSRQPISNLHHIGIYAYQAWMLKKYEEQYTFCRELINDENLEQMNFYEFNIRFAVLNHESPTFSINTQEDYDEWLQR